MAGGNVKAQTFSPNFDREGVPLCIRWSEKDVADWVSHIGFPQYQECFTTNGISGRQLILVDASSLPRLGITDFKHILVLTPLFSSVIAKKCRELLGIEDPDWSRSISLPPYEPLAHFLERKSVTGKESDFLRLEDHIRYLKKFNEHGVPRTDKMT